MDDLETNRQLIAAIPFGHNSRRWMKRDHGHHPHGRHHHHHRHGPRGHHPKHFHGERHRKFGSPFCPASKVYNDLDQSSTEQTPRPQNHHIHMGCGHPKRDMCNMWLYFLEEMSRGEFVRKKCPKKDNAARDDRMAEIRKRMSWLNLASPSAPKPSAPKPSASKPSAPNEAEEEAGPSKE